MEAIEKTIKLKLKMYAFYRIYIRVIEGIYSNSSIFLKKDEYQTKINPPLFKLCDWMEGEYVQEVELSLQESFEESKLSFQNDKKKVLKILKKLKKKVKKDQSQYFIGGVRNEFNGVMTFHIELSYTIDRTAIRIKNFIPKRKEKVIKNLQSVNAIETSVEKLTRKLSNNNFINLNKVNKLSEKGISELINLIDSNKAPYCIAMLDYLGFINYLKNENSLVESKTNKIISIIIDTNERNVRGLRNSLLDYSKENKVRYNAYKYKEQVRNDYKKLT